MIGHMDVVQVRGKAIRAAYQAKGFERAEFAEAARIPAKTITNVTSRDVSSVSLPRAVRMADVLDCPLEELLAETAASVGAA